MKPAMSRLYEGQLYYVRRKGKQRELVSGTNIQRNGWDSFVEIKPLYVDPEYNGDNPECWRVWKWTYSESYSREKLEQKHPDREVEALRFRDDVEQRSLNEVIA